MGVLEYPVDDPEAIREGARSWRAARIGAGDAGSAVADQRSTMAARPDLEGYLPEDDFPDPAVLIYIDSLTLDLDYTLLAADWLELLRTTEL